jgi:acid phosphatase
MRSHLAVRAPARILTVLAVACCAACGTTGVSPVSAAFVAQGLQAKVQNIVVIYAENRSFDNLFGNFPGANGLGTVLDGTGQPTSAYVAQKDRDGSTVLATLPQTWKGVTMPGQSPAVTQAQSAGLPNRPFALETAFQSSAGATLSMSTVTRDLYHRFFEHQMQINSGKNDMFAAWADAGGLAMGHFDYSGSAIYKLARQYVLADNFFQGAFGGSFLNHQYLICACAPEYPSADSAAAKPAITVLDKDGSGAYLPRLTLASTSPVSAMDGPPQYMLSGNLTPANYFGDGKFYAVNTMQPPYQPSGNTPATVTDHGALMADASNASTLPPQTQTTIGDLLSAKGVDWKWYAGSWNAAVTDGMQPPGAPRAVIYAANASKVATKDHVDFQAHHQPFNYYAAFDPVTRAADRVRHLKDYNDLVADAAAGTLPPVAFYKPEGVYNQHAGYANLIDGDAKIADLVAKLQASPQWKNMVVVITYDEFGGMWDHVAPPKGDKLGPGTRIPAIIVSPLARMGSVDHAPYDTGSVLRLITRRFGLGTLPGLAARDAALKANGGPVMGDLTSALNLD